MLFALEGWKLFRFHGADRKKYLNGLITNDVIKLVSGQGMAACLLTPKGMLQAHFWLYDEGESLLAVCPPECAGNFEAGVSKLLMLSQTTLEKPQNRVALGKGGPLACPRFGEGFGFFLDEAGGEGYEALRMEAAVPRYGVDVDDKTVPLEAGFEDAISFTKGCYMGQETISRIHHLGHVNRRLVCLKLSALVEPGAVVTLAGKDVGRVTSVAYSARFGAPLALAMLRVEALEPGAVLRAGPAAVSLVLSQSEETR